MNKKIVSGAGMALCVAGILLSAISGVAFFSVPNDPTGAGKLYDESVEAYNKQVDEFAEANPKLPAPISAKTRLQVHKEDTMFGACGGAIMIAVGIMLCYLNRSKPEAVSSEL